MAKFWKEYEVNCPACHGDKVIMAGQRNGYQRYRCRSCDKWFRADGQAERRKNVYDAEMIGATIRDYYGGLSIKNLAQSIEDRYEIPEPSKSTIYRWISAYTDQARHALRDVKAQATGDHWVIDELFVKVGGVRGYVWITMDKKSRYILAAHLSLDRDGKSATQALLKALDVAGQPPKCITTDKAKAYPPALSALLPGVKHIKSEGIESWINNNMIERLNGTYRAREKVLRGMDSLESGQQWIDGFTIYYNFFRDHHALKGRRPAQVAKAEIPFKEWADFVRADIEVPASCRKKEVKRGTPKVPVRYIERARTQAEIKKEKRKGIGRVRAPQAVPEAFQPNRQMRLAYPELNGATRATTRLKGHHSELKPVKARAKVDAPKPILPKPLASNPKIKQHSLLPLMEPSRFTRPKPAGTRR